VVPANTAVMAGGELALVCRTNSTTRLSWYFGRAKMKIFNGFNVSPEFPRYTIRSSSSYDLVISDIKLSDAGLYWCVHSKSRWATAEVVVLGKNDSSLRSFVCQIVRTVIGFFFGEVL